MKRTIGLLLLMPLLGAGCPGGSTPSLPGASSAKTDGVATTPQTASAPETETPTESEAGTDPAPEPEGPAEPAKPDYPAQPEGKYIVRYYEMPG